MDDDLSRRPKEGHGFIYRYTFDNGKCYIGQTTKSIEERTYYHRRNRTKNRTLVDAVILKGHEFKIDMLTEVPLDILDIAERYCICHFKTVAPNGYNIIKGGQTFRGYDTPEFKRRHSEGLRRWAEANGKKLSNGQKSRFQDPEEKERLHRNLSEYRLNNRPVNCKKVIHLETGTIYDSIKDAEKHTKSSKITEVLRGKRYTSNGQHWIEYSEYNLANRDVILQCFREWDRTMKTFNIRRQSGRLDDYCKEKHPRYNQVKIQCIETGEIFDSITQASDMMGICRRLINKNLSGERRIASGHHFARI